MKILGRRFILLKNLIPNPLNTRGPVAHEDAVTMRDSLLAGGQRTDLIVRLPTLEEIAQYGPEARIILGGHIRRAGAELGSLEGLWAVECELEPGEEDLIILGDNVHTTIGWWKFDLGLERRLKSEPKISQRQLAAQLGITNAKISQAWKILGALNPVAREAVEKNLASPGSTNRDSVNSINTPEAPKGPKGKAKTKPKGPYRINRTTLLILADLEDPNLVEKAVIWVIEHKRNEPEAEKLVEWIQAGHNLEDFPQKALKDTLEDPYAAYWVHLGPAFKVKYKGGEDYEVHFKVNGRQATWNAASAASKAIQAMPGSHSLGEGSGIQTPSAITLLAPAPTTHPHMGWFSGLVGGIFWKEVKSTANRVLHRVFPRSPRWFNQLTAQYQKLDVKHQFWAAFLTAGLVLFLGNLLIHGAGRLLNRMAYSFAHSTQVVAPPITKPAPRSFNEGGSPGVGGAGPISSTPQSTFPSVLPTQSSAIAGTNSKGKGGIQYSATVVIPVRGSSVTGAVNSKDISVEGPKVFGKKVLDVKVDNPLNGLVGGLSNSTQNPELKTQNLFTPIPEPSGSEEEAQFVQDFVGHLYSASYLNYLECLRYFAHNIVAGNCGYFFERHFSMAKRKKLKDQELVMSFKPDGPPKFIKYEHLADDDQYSMTGIVTTKSDITGKVVSQKAVSVLMGVDVEYGPSHGKMFEFYESP